MSWEEGKQKRPQKRFLTLDEMEKIEGFLDEDQAKLLIYQFLRTNPTFFAKILTGIDIFPFQHIALKSMFDTDYGMYVWGRGLSKSFSAAFYVVMEALLNQGIDIAILSRSYRQSRMIFKKIEDLREEPNAHLLRECIPANCISKGNTECLMKVGRSTIRALPLGDGEKLRGFRFQRIVVDEFLLMPEKIYKEIILPFLAVVKNPSERQKRYELETQLIREGKLKEEERYEWPSNKLMALSSASYQFEYLYSLYKEYESLILNKQVSNLGKEVKKDARRCILHFSHEVAPSQLYDASAVQQSKSSMSASQFAREYGAEFTDDSSGYFSVKKMNECTIQDGMEPSVEISGDASAEYIVSFDPSWAETDSSDDFAIQVIKYDRNSGVGVLVHSYAIAGTPLGSHIKYFKYILDQFKPVLLIGDYNGGQQFLSSCNESVTFKDAGIELKTIPCELFDDPDKIQKNLNEARTLYSQEQKRIVILRQPSSNWIRQANESLQASIDHQKINFAAAAYDSHYNSQIKKNIGIKDLTFSKEDSKFVSDGEGSKMVDFLEHQVDMIKLTKKECGLIQVSSSPQGSQVFDLPANLKKQTGSNKTRKDSYSALVLANWGMKVYSDIMAAPVEEVESTFTPMFIR